MIYDDFFYQLGHWLIGLCVVLVVGIVIAIIHSRNHLKKHLKALSERRKRFMRERG